MAKNRRIVETEWSSKPHSKKMDPRALSAIARRRRQMLIHSYLYYRMDSPVIPDETWTHWAQQLERLQRKFGWRIGFYDEAFRDWNGSSGFHLPADADVVRVARRIHDEVMERRALVGDDT